MATTKEPTGWIGWVGFASFMLLLGGMFALLAGVVALFKDTTVYNSATNNAFILSYDQWGWAHILIGLLAVWAGSSLMRGGMYGRIIAVLVALVSAVVNVAFIPVYPIWATIIVVVDVLVIFAVTVHGREMKGLSE